jgi:RNA polymerase sigma-70 factor (ECF subfamily)
LGSGRLQAYLLRVVRNACIDHLRANKRWSTVMIDEDTPFAGPLCEASALSAALYEAIDQVLLRLPETQRAVFVLSEYEGLSYQEISEIIGCPFGTVASRKHKAMEALRAQLRPWLDGGEG